jgi:hypothetical protein
MALFNFQSVVSEMDSNYSVIEVQLTVKRVPSAVAPVVEQLMLLIKACRLVRREDRTLETALREVFHIAVADHDSERPENTREIQVKCRCESEKEVSVTIRLAEAVKGARQVSSAGAPRGDFALESRLQVIGHWVDELRVEPDGTAIHLRKRVAGARASSTLA